MSLILPRRRFIAFALAAPSIVRAQPFPGMLAKSAGFTGLLDQLSGTTTIIGAWSVCRALKGITYSAGAMKARSNDTGSGTVIGFNGTIINTTALNALWSSGLAVGVNELFDQSGNGNHLFPQSGASDGILIGTGGSYTSPVTVAGGTSLPMLGFGAGNQSGSTGVNPNMVTTVPMPVSFSATAKNFMICVLKPTSGAGSGNFNHVAEYLHTGDSSSSSATTSVAHMYTDGSTTNGIYSTTGGGSDLSKITLSPAGGLHLAASVYDGTDSIMYVDRVAGTSVAFTASLGSGGSYCVGAHVSNPTLDVWNGFIPEILIGQFTSTPAIFAAGDLVVIQNNMRTFYGTP